LDSHFNYFSEIIKKNLNIIKKSLPKYLSYRRLKTLTIELIGKLKSNFNTEQKPAKILGNKLIENLKSHLFNQIETSPILLSRDLNYEEKTLREEFVTLVNQNSDLFFKNISLKIDDLVSFAEIQIEKEIGAIKKHINKFKKFPTELHYLLSYILRYSTINRYLKEEPEKEI